jgi:hypothetical protein
MVEVVLLVGVLCRLEIHVVEEAVPSNSAVSVKDGVARYRFCESLI